MKDDDRDVIAKRLNEAAEAKYGGRKHGRASLLARDSGLPVQNVARWLRGASLPSEAVWAPLANALGCPVAWLRGYSEEKPAAVKKKVSGVEALAAGVAIAAVWKMLDRLKPQISEDQLVQITVDATDHLIETDATDAELRSFIASKMVEAESS